MRVQRLDVLQWMTCRLVLLPIMLLASIAWADAAFAHASLLQTSPTDGTVLANSPETLTLRFNEPVSPTVFKVIDPSGAEIIPTSVEALNETVTVKLGNRLPDGTSLLSYRIISADGHPVGGTISFSIGHPTHNAVALTTTDQSVARAIWVTRILIYLGLFVGVGGPFFRHWIAAPASKQDSSASVIGGAMMVCALFASALALGLQGLDALGLPLTHIGDRSVWSAGLATTYATSLGFSAIAIVLALYSGRPLPRVASKPISMLALLMVGMSLASSGHVSTIEPTWVSRSAVFLHTTAVAFWGGALLPMLFSVASREPQVIVTLRRFSFWAIPSVIILFIAGTGMAKAQLENVSSLWLTDYGTVLLAKLVVVGLLLGLAGINYVWLTPAVLAGKSIASKRLRWTISGEIVLIVAILGLVALWRFTPPPRALLAAAAQPAHIHIHQQRAMVDLTMAPASTGPVTITMQFLSGDFGPLVPKEVTIELSKPESGIEAIERKATLGAGDIWNAGPMIVPLAGKWHVRVDALISDFDKVILEDELDIPR